MTDSSLFLNTNINTFRCIKLTISLIPWILAFVIQIVIFGIKIKGQVCYCHITTAWSPSGSLKIVLITSTMQIITILIWICIYIQSKATINKFNLNCKSYGLVHRFSLWSNLKISKWLLPTIQMDIIIAVVRPLISTLTRNLTTHCTVSYYHYVTLSNYLQIFEIIILPVLLIR